MAKWMLYNKRADFVSIAQKFHIDPLIAKVLRNKDLTTDEQINRYLNGGINDLYDPHRMKDMDKGVSVIIEKINHKKKIRVVNDYDVDGVASGHILYSALKRCGADVSIRVPDRIKDGYGLNRNIIEEAHTDGIDTIITCDNGIAALEEIAYAKEFGMTIVVTDHHSIPFEKDENGKIRYLKSVADAIINPHQIDCGYPYDGLCGAAVAWKFICVLYEKLGIAKGEAYDMIEFVAFATVADVMELTDENRILVKLGLKKINTGMCSNTGLKLLIEENSLQPDQVSAYHFGFVLGPCVNASGRLETAKIALRLFQEADTDKARKIAKRLIELNEERKALTLEGVEAAEEQIKKFHMEKDKVLVIYLPDVHESLAGIIAGRIRETYYRPVFVLTKGENGVKGSGRSIEEYSMFEEMNKCKEFLDGFGGHPMAAGLSLQAENIGSFRSALNEKTTLTDVDLVEKIHIDAAMPLSYVSMPLVMELDYLAPFGKGNEKPKFAEKDVEFAAIKVIGKNKNVLKIRLKENNVWYTAVSFGTVDQFEALCLQKYGKDAFLDLVEGKGHYKFSILYEPEIDSYNGRDSLQFIIRDFC